MRNLALTLICIFLTAFIAPAWAGEVPPPGPAASPVAPTAPAAPVPAVGEVIVKREAEEDFAPTADAPAAPDAPAPVDPLDPAIRADLEATIARLTKTLETTYGDLLEATAGRDEIRKRLDGLELEAAQHAAALEAKHQDLVDESARAGAAEGRARDLCTQIETIERDRKHGA